MAEKTERTGHQPVNIGDIARELNVSKTTVSRAISGKGRIGEETKQRVLACIQAHNYRPSIMARGLAQNKTYNLALVVGKRFSSLDLPFLRKSMRAVCETAAQRDYDVLLIIAGDRDVIPMRRLLDNRKIDGVILTRSIEDDPYVTLLKEREMPFVVFGHEAPDILQVDNDQIGASRELTSLLLMRGLRRIALLGGEAEYIVNKSRLEGYRQAFERMGLQVDERMIIMGLESDAQRVGGLDAALARRPDCILCMDDALTIFTKKILDQKGMKIPQDVALASLYDADALTEQNPAITAVRFDAAMLGQTATTLLLNKLEHQPVPTCTIQGFQLMIRSSTGR